MVLLPASRRTILFVLTVAISAFAVLHLGALVVEYATGDPELFHRLHLEEIRRQLHLEHESNLTTWYSSATLLFCASLLWIIARDRLSRREAFAAHWVGLAAVFLYLSIDETAMLHEGTMPLMDRLFQPSGVFRFGWVIIALPVVVVFLLTYFRFLVSLPRPTRVALIVAGTVYLSGGLGLEMVEGVIDTQGGGSSLAMMLARTFEEILEMVGVLLFIRAFLDIVVARHGTAENLDAA